MQNLDFKVGFGRKKEPRYMRNYTWVAVAIGGSAVLGAGVSMYGANKQSKAMQDAQNKNAELQTQQNNSAWQGYLMSRGLDPMGATSGNIPSGGRALNTKLPLWATVNLNRSGTVPKITGMSRNTGRPGGTDWWKPAAGPSGPSGGGERSWGNLSMAV
jgi:hypothetical protein